MAVPAAVMTALDKTPAPRRERRLKGCYSVSTSGSLQTSLPITLLLLHHGTLNDHGEQASQCGLPRAHLAVCNGSRPWQMGPKGAVATGQRTHKVCRGNLFGKSCNHKPYRSISSLQLASGQSDRPQSAGGKRIWEH